MFDLSIIIIGQTLDPLIVVFFFFFYLNFMSVQVLVQAKFMTISSTINVDYFFRILFKKLLCAYNNFFEFS